MLPKRIGNLEIISLMAGNIEKGLVTGKVKILARRSNAYCLATLRMHVAPEMRRISLADH